MWKLLAVVLVTATVANPALARTQRSTLPGGSPVIGQFVRGLKPGIQIKLKLISGDTVKGLLIATDEDAVTVKPRTRLPEPAQQVKLSEIVDAEVVNGTSVGKAVAIGAAVGAGAALGFLFLLVMAYGGD